MTKVISYLTISENKQIHNLIKILYWNYGYSQQAIANELNVTQAVIYKWMKRFQIKIKPQGYHAIKHGLSMKGKKYYCKECGVQISDYRKSYCNNCFQLGERNPAYKGGTSKYYCKECGTEISYGSAHYGTGLCKDCGLIERQKHYKKEKHGCWKGGLPKCVDCGKEVSSRYYKRCHKCGLKRRVVLKGKDHPFYGKSPKTYKVVYKNMKFKSFWEFRFAEWLDYNKIKWRYEPKIFDLIIYKKQTGYIPDFYLPEFDCWIEIKGWMRKDSLRKINAFKRKYIKENLFVFNGKILKMLGISIEK